MIISRSRITGHTHEHDGDGKFDACFVSDGSKKKKKRETYDGNTRYGTARTEAVVRAVTRINVDLKMTPYSLSLFVRRRHGAKPFVIRTKQGDARQENETAVFSDVTR